MRFRILAALFLSFLLILGAAFVRSREANATLPTIVAVDNPTPVVADALSSGNYASTTPAALSEPLRTTDLVSRQILSDYMNLAATGQATEDNINALADKYVQSIPNLEQTRSINVTDIRIVPDSQKALQAYANLLLTLTKESNSAAAQIDSSSIDTSGTDVSGISTKLGSAYQKVADKLLLIQVPSSLIEDDIALVNMYLSNASALNSLSQMDSDPAVAFAGLAKFNENLKAEVPLLSDMKAIFNSHGIQ